MADRKKYTPEFRQELARLVIDTGQPIAQVARDYNVGQSLLGRWVQKERERQGMRQAEEPLTVSERARLKELEKENARLKMEVEFLGKATAFFAARRQNMNGLS